METASFKKESSCNRQRNRHIPIGLVIQAGRPSHMNVTAKGIQVLKTRWSRNVAAKWRGVSAVSCHTRIRVSPNTFKFALVRHGPCEAGVPVHSITSSCCLKCIATSVCIGIMVVMCSVLILYQAAVHTLTIVRYETKFKATIRTA
jgi:hypothetical protein